VTFRRLIHRLAALFTGRRLDRELNDEIQAHLELAERDAIAAGLSPEQARREARLRFGGIDQMREVHRDQRSLQWLDSLWRDMRYGVAALRRDPTFTIAAVGVLALGIGANAAVFSLMDAVLFKPLPFSEPERMVRLWETPTPTTANQTNTLSFIEWKRQNRSFAALSATAPIAATAIIGGEPVRLPGRLVTADYFNVFALSAMLGRTFIASDDQVGATPVVVLSHDTWQAQFGGNPGVLNRDLMLDGEPFRVIGVLPPGAFDRDPSRYWVPLKFTPERMNGSHWLEAVGRLETGVTLAQAQQDMLGIRARMADQMPSFKKGWSIRVEPFDLRLVGDTLRRQVYIAFGAVALVLLIATANVANLVLAKGVSRRKELAVRAALGASRGRLIAQLLTETLVLSLLGGLVGVALAAGLLKAAIPLLPSSVPTTAEITLDLRVLAFAGLAVMIVTILVGLAPALRASAGNLAQTFQQTSRGSSGAHGRMRRAIVVAEVAISLVLVCGALLLFKSLARLQQVDIGVRVDHVVAMSADLPANAYSSAAQVTTFYDAVVERLVAIPGVEQAAVSQDVPLEEVRGGEGLRLPGGEDRINVRFKRVDARYFDTLEIPVVAGRGLAPTDREGAPRVIVINQTLANRFRERFAMDNPLGRLVTLPAIRYRQETTLENMEIVGVIRDERVQRDLSLPPIEVVYVPLAQMPRREINLIVRTTQDPSALVPALRAAIRDVDPRLAVAEVRTMEQVKERSLAGAAAPTWLIGGFAIVAALLAAIGLYGVLAHAVGEQRREIGIRMAIGARTADVQWQFVRHAVWMIGLGLLIGLAGAAAITRVTETLLFEVSAFDPAAFGVAVVSMLVVGVTAALIPARRAAHVDPTTVLRSEG
jgi:putative ABC transport system permease protein